MSEVTLVRKSLELTPEQWAALDRLAAEFNAVPNSGPTPARPSWRTLVKEIAQGRLTITKGNGQ